jgi:hypothetical protein
MRSALARPRNSLLAMARYEYCTLEWQGRRSKNERELNRLGRDGWLVVSSLAPLDPPAVAFLVLCREVG